MKFKTIDRKSPVKFECEKLLFGIWRDAETLEKNQGIILVGDGTEPKRNEVTSVHLYPIAICDLNKIEELKKQTNSKDDNELLNKIVSQEKSDIIDLTEMFK